MGKRPSPASTAQKCAAASSSSSPPPLLLRCHQSVNAPFPSSSLLFPSVFSPQKKTRKKQLFLYSTLLLLLGGRCQHRGRAQKHGISQFCSDSLATHVSSREKSFNFFYLSKYFSSRRYSSLRLFLSSNVEWIMQDLPRHGYGQTCFLEMCRPKVTTSIPHFPCNGGTATTTYTIGQSMWRNIPFSVCSFSGNSIRIVFP